MAVDHHRPQGDQAGMTIDRALDINRRLVTSWFIWNKYQPGPYPDLERVSLAEAVKASEMVQRLPPSLDGDGSMRFTQFVNPTVVASLHALVQVENAMARIQADHQARVPKDQLR